MSTDVDKQTIANGGSLIPRDFAKSHAPEAISSIANHRVIVYFDSGHVNDIPIMAFAEPVLARHGYTVERVTFNSPTDMAHLRFRLNAGASEIFCFLSLNYAIKLIEPGDLLLHQRTGIPLVVHMCDHPLYFLGDESPAFDGTFVFAPGDDLIDFMTKHFGSTVIGIRNAAFTPPPFASYVPDPANFFARENGILCPMNLSISGTTVDGFWQRIKTLPSARRARAIRLVDASLYDCITPLHVISERLTMHNDREIELSDQLIVLNFLKLWRRTRIVRALIDLPILVASDFVPADLELKYPDKFTAKLPMAETFPLYERYRFTLNSFPLMTYALHDHLMNAFFANSVMITDRNAYSMQLFRDEVELIYLDYEAQDMAAKVRPYIEEPERAYQITVNSYERRVNGEGMFVDSYGDLIEAVKQVWIARQSSAAAR